MNLDVISRRKTASYCSALVFLCLFSLGFARAQTTPTVDLAFDFLAAFSTAKVTDALSGQVLRPARCGGIAKNGLGEHPQITQRPARVEYALSLPSVKNGERLLLAFDIGLMDGIQFGRGEDGVRFAVEIGGRRLLAKEMHECRWEPHAVDLTDYAGHAVELAFVVDALGNTTYDWAAWGNPRLLHFRGPAWLQSGQTTIPVGALAVAYRPGQPFKVSLRPTPDSKGVEWETPATKTTSPDFEWVVLDFDFPTTTNVAFECEPPASLVQALLAAYPAKPVLQQISAAGSVPGPNQPLPLLVTVRNEGRGLLSAGGALVDLQVGRQSLPMQAVPPLASGEVWTGQWLWRTPAVPGRQEIIGRLVVPGIESVQQKSAVIETFPAPMTVRTRILQNELLRLEFIHAGAGFAYARLLAKHNGTWTLAGVWRPLIRIVEETRKGELDWDLRPQQVAEPRLPSQSRQTNALDFTAQAFDPDGVGWLVTLHVSLEPGRPVAHVSYDWKAAGPRRIKALWGPNLYVGEETTGDAKIAGLFPGLEFLAGGERSSNPRDLGAPLDDRRTPDPRKITVPLMAVTIGPGSQPPPANPSPFYCPDAMSALRAAAPTETAPLTVAMMWNPRQKWDGEHALPSARFASPNFDEGMRNHRMGLFLPSVPDFVPENADRAAHPFELEAGKTLTLSASLFAGSGPIMTAMQEWYRQKNGLPKPGPWPRSFEDELALCRQGFLETVWDAPNEKWRHCIDWASSHAPGFATLLWLEAQATTNSAGRSQSLERVELAGQNMLRDGGPALFLSPANCHIMRWEFPFYYGYLPESLAALEPQIQKLIQSQQAGGGWSFQPADDQQKGLGEPGDSVLGLNASQAASLLRYARITGDPAARAASEKALEFMERFRVPRGGQTWECPMYEPDILPAGWAILAGLEGYRATGNTRWLHDAVYWAETGLPFVYHWSLDNRPMMLGATIPVFGSTFYTHSWLGMPVQWCGLVYAYHLFHLAQQLAQTPLPPSASMPPVTLGLSPQDWQQIVELISISACHQQFADGPRAGAYPDSITNFEQRNPAFINPEDILANLLALRGYDPEVKTVRLAGPRGDIVISSGAGVENARLTPAGLEFQLRFFPGANSHTLISGLKPNRVQFADQTLSPSAEPVRRDPGWWWDAKRNWSFLVVPQEKETVTVTVAGS